MKKSFILLSFLAVAALFVGCNNNEEFVTPQSPKQDLTKPQTEIFVQGQLLSYDAPQTRANYTWPLVNEAEGWETARFSIRADNGIVGVQDMPSAQYFGRKPGKVGNNKGKVYGLYPYGHYNDRDFDYYQKDKKTGENIGLFRYVYDPEGQKTQLAIMEKPTVEEILLDEKEDLENAIANGQNVTKNTADLEKVNSWLAMGNDYLDSHVLWYVVKEVGMKNGWHVNGIISDHEVPTPDKDDFNKLPDNVEVDVHQQVHKDWNEIKTSVHIRADVESVTVNIPLKQEDVIERDDFAIRVFNFDYSEYHITHTVTHDEKGITIQITNIPAALIQTLKNNFGDGLTIEIHSYCTTEDVWEQLSKSSVKTGKTCTVTGQIHSAMHPDPNDPTKEAERPIYVNP